MRKFSLAIAAAGAALGTAAPASAQFYPQPAYGYGYAPPAYGYGYQSGYGYAPRSYGYQSAYGYAPRGYGYNGAGIVQRLDYRIGGIRSQIRGMQARGLLRWNKARNLDRQAVNLQRRVHQSAWNGVGGFEARSLELRVARLEQQLRYASVRQRYAPRYGARYAPRYGVRYAPRYAGYRW